MIVRPLIARLSVTVIVMLMAKINIIVRITSTSLATPSVLLKMPMTIPVANLTIMSSQTGKGRFPKLRSIG